MLYSITVVLVRVVAKAFGAKARLTNNSAEIDRITASLLNKKL
jgi:hypothetical protein